MLTLSLGAKPSSCKACTKVLVSAVIVTVVAVSAIILADAAPELKEFADLLGYPVTNTLMGLGGFPGTSPQFVGMLGMHGTYEANMAMQHCDVLISVGARFDDRVIGNPKHFAQNARKIIHVDIDPASIAKNVDVDVPIVGPVVSVLSEMNALLEANWVNRTDDQEKLLAEWWSQIEGWRKQDCLAVERDEHDTQIKPQEAVQAVYRATNGTSYVTTDVGQHQMFAALYYPFDEPRKWINSGGLGTMGFGLPAAMGVQMAFPEEVLET